MIFVSRNMSFLEKAHEMETYITKCRDLLKMQLKRRSQRNKGKDDIMENKSNSFHPLFNLTFITKLKRVK